MKRHWTLLVVVADIRPMFSYPGFQAPGCFSNVGQPTGTPEHVNDIVSVTCNHTFNAQLFPCEGVMKGLSLDSEIALGTLATFVIALGNLPQKMFWLGRVVGSHQ